VEVSLLGYGAMELRGSPRGRDLSEDEVGRILNRVLDSGITLIDTAIDYELSEERIGRHLAHRRSEYFLASKCGCLVGWQRPADYKGGMAGGGPHDFSPDNIRKGVEQSLVRLRTDHLDLVQLHGSPDRRTLEEDDVIEVLHQLQSEGKTRFIGMSGVLPSLADHIRMDVFDVFQVPYSALQREHEQAISDAAGAGAGVLVRGGVARGAPSGEQRAVKRSPGLAENWDQARMAEVLDGMSPMEFTLRFTMSHPGVSSVLVGTANLDHLEANVEAAARGALAADLYDEAKQRFALRTEEV
jgi:aryl-alcohol dehydrogenase-like predicted oxidoreductase